MDKTIAKDDNGRYILSSVDSALSILNLFFEHEDLSTSEVAGLIGVSRSTAFRFMVTLEARGFVSKTERGRFRLGMNLFSLGMLSYRRMELVERVHPYLADMARASGETCHLSVLDDGVHVMFIDRALGTSWLKMDTPLGYRQYAHCTATGKAMLSHQSEAEINQYLREAEFPRLTDASIKDAAELLRALDRVRLDGCACDNEEAELGLTCYAVPLVDAAGRAYAAISVSGPTARMIPSRQKHLERLNAAAAAISGAIR